MNAEGFFSTLGHLVTSQLPQAQLLSLLTEVKKKQLLNTEERIKKMAGTDMKLTDRSIESVSRAALIYTVPEAADHKRKEQRRKKEQVRRYMRDISKDAIYAEDRELALQELWPRILTDMVRAAVIDMIRMDVYMKGCLEKLCNS
ncbi:hypothetical protein NP493_3g03000 [Ridgeia piscesae]|uniref:Uncharacterized protein n=1 Tax=Ridgeia piscesae TaxID=27915 RepID=A0AAD9PFR9_RIDPI|nr:hypothetical protein NP493_3g03000 [Ridgeia piscesae]